MKKKKLTEKQIIASLPKRDRVKIAKIKYGVRDQYIKDALQERKVFIKIGAVTLAIGLLLCLFHVYAGVFLSTMGIVYAIIPQLTSGLSRGQSFYRNIKSVCFLKFQHLYLHHGTHKIINRIIS